MYYRFIKKTFVVFELVLTITFLALLDLLEHVLTQECEQTNEQERKML